MIPSIFTTILWNLFYYNYEKVEELDLSHSQLTELPDLSLWPNLKRLNCSFNNIRKLPTVLPSSLEYFNCSFNLIDELPDLSNCIHLKYINFSSNKVSLFPTKLSSSLEYINCFSNKLVCLPSELPPLLKYFNCFHNNISYLPCLLPNELEYFDCYANPIYALPNLPYTLKHFYAFNTKSLDICIYPLTSDYKKNIKIINVINRFREIYYSKKYGYKILLYLRNNINIKGKR